jgi:carboxylesterase
MIYVVLAIGVIGVVLRARHLRSMERLVLSRRRVGSDGIAIGAAGFTLEQAGAPALLLLHGAGDTPQTLRYLADALHARGFHVSVPLLPGHGRSIRDFRRVTADALTSAAHEHYDELRASHEWVGVIGLSMGGALAVQIAAAHHELPALGLVAPYLSMPRRIARAARWSSVWGLFTPVVRSTEGLSVLDPAERESNLAYGVFTASALRALYETMRRADDALPRVTAPTLWIQSRRDNRISVENGERSFARLGAHDKCLEWTTEGAHIITVDFGRDAVIARLAAFMASHAPRAKTANRVTSDS